MTLTASRRMSTGGSEGIRRILSAMAMSTRSKHSRHTLVSQNADLLVQAVSNARLALCLTDPGDDDNPIVYANAAFLKLTGYDEDEVLGRNCRFLQGPETDRAAVERVREIIAGREVSTVELLNYRKDGSSFLNALQLGPIYGADGELAYYFGSQFDVTEERETEKRKQQLVDAELRHRLMNIINVLGVLVRLTGQEGLSPEEQVERIDGRLHAVGKAHLLALTQDENTKVDIHEMARVVLDAYAPRGEASYSLIGPDIAVGGRALTPFTLILHELSTNAVKHGALNGLKGHVALEWTLSSIGDEKKIALEWRETGGPQVTEPERESGSALVTKLVRASGGELSFDWRPEGLVAGAILPVT